ncbi:fructosamine kinase family protein [Formosa sp. S-31]|uniref:fructosamine kinase family protein n=1 Tax=Formosa sp. S-31 TaxID=2790949 RepID=UPI003EC00358
MDKEFISHISTRLHTSITSIHSVTGGDISSAFKIITPNKNYFLKTNSASNALHMFESEAGALETIANTNAMSTPDVIDYSTFQNTSYLLLEYIEGKSPTQKNFKILGEQLAELHQNTNSYFGLKQDNFIGSLKQFNKPSDSWNAFYVNERLYPQLQLALQNQLLLECECPSKSQISDKLEPFFLNIKPSLLHGDLWSGNYLISTDGIPYLIDPAMYFGHHEVDIAMTKLFGGFSEDFYDAYHKIIPADKFTSNRIDIYQLYYLLIHLNLFGKSYRTSVINLLNKYF